MRKEYPQLFSWKRKRHSVDAHSMTVGLAVLNGKASAVACDGEVDGRPHVVASTIIPASDSHELLEGLRNFVQLNNLQGWACRSTLSPDHYSLHLVERPANIPEAELVDATRWLIRDLIDFDVEQAELAILTIPENASRARTPRMFVVAAKHESTSELVHVIQAAGLDLIGFEIIESTLLALETRMPQVVAGSAVLRIDDKSSVLTLSYAERLYLTRNLNVDSNSIEAAAERALSDPSPSNPEVLESLDPLLLDIQRSLDYYESEYGQAGASRLTLMPSNLDLTPLIPALTEALRPVKIEIFDLTHYFEFDEHPSTNSHPSLAIAAGATIAPPHLLGGSLLPKNLRESAGGFGLRATLQIAAAVALFFGAYCIFSQFSLNQEREALSFLEDRKAQLDMQVETLKTEAAARSTETDSNQIIQALRSQRNARLAVLRDLGQHRNGPNSSFSSLLAGLARQDLEGVWLERIEFTEGGDSIAIDGRSLVASDIPKFLRRLGTEASFENRKFRTFEIIRQPNFTNGLAFHVSTLGKNDPSDGGGR